MPLPTSQSQPPLLRRVPIKISPLKSISAPAAESIGVSYLGRELVSATPTGGSYSGTIRLPTAGADLVVMARWSGTRTAALRVKVSNQDGPVAEASYWGTDRVEDVLAIPESPE